MSIEFRCHATNEEDCHLFVPLYEGSETCKYCKKEECASSVYRAWAMKRELKKIGIDAEFKGTKED